MSDERASHADPNGSTPWLDWIVKPLRQLLGWRAADGRPLAPLAAAPRAGGRGPIVERSRAGDVYRL